MSDALQPTSHDVAENAASSMPLAPAAQGGPHIGMGSIVLIVGIVAAGLVFALALVRQNQSQPTTGAAPDFEFTTFDEQTTMHLSDLKGKVVFLNFWASWCAPCEDEAPELQAAWEHYAPRGDVVFLGIAYADNGPGSLAYLEEFGITYLNAPDLGTRISRAYNIVGVPESFLIDKDGTIVEFIYAGITAQRLQALIDPLLEG